MVIVSKICTYDVFLIEKQKFVYEAVALMKKHNIKKLLVVDEKEHAYFPVGLLSSFDILLNLITSEVNTPQTKIEEIIYNQSLVMINEDQNLEEALNLMAYNKIKQLLVIDEDNKLIGVLSLDNIILFLASRQKLNYFNLVSKALSAQIPEHFNY